MLDYHIRLYKDSDYDTVRDIFAHGITEHYPTGFRHTLSLPRVWILIVLVFLLALMTTASSVASSIAVIAVILALWLINRDMYFSYVSDCLVGDMLDIRRSYLQRHGCCFWVAESAGDIVGTVAAAPFPHADEQNQVELKRLSVIKKHRGKGIGTALCKTVIDFSQKSGYGAIVLQTSIFQVDCVRLYKRLGFRMTDSCYPDYVFAKFINFTDIYFQYDLAEQ